MLVSMATCFDRDSRDFQRVKDKTMYVEVGPWEGHIKRGEKIMVSMAIRYKWYLYQHNEIGILRKVEFLKGKK